MKKKLFVIGGLCVFVLLISAIGIYTFNVAHVRDRIKYTFRGVDPEERIEEQTGKSFKTVYKSHFENVNNAILHLAQENSIIKSELNELGYSGIIFDKENAIIKGISTGLDTIPVSKSFLESLNMINEFMPSDFSFIKIDKQFVSYYGEGSTMIRYSINGDVPTFFYVEGDGVDDFKCVKLDDHWYYLWFWRR